MKLGSSEAILCFILLKPAMIGQRHMKEFNSSNEYAAKRLNVAHTERKIFEPQHNLLLGSDHLCTLLNDFDHS